MNQPSWDSVSEKIVSTPVPSGSSPQTVPAPPASVPSSPAAPVSSPSSPASRSSIPLRSPQDIDMRSFNALVGDWQGKPVDDIKQLFVKQVILDDETKLAVETIKVPGFIGIADDLEVTNPSGAHVSGHADIAEVLKRDGLLICTYQWNKERYGVPLDLRQPLEQDIFTEAFIKNEGHHSGAVVPAQRQDRNQWIDSYGTMNEPDAYHAGLYGSDGYVAVAQRLVFPDFVTPKQARGYTDSIICWMGLLNPFTQFPPDYNGGDPTRIADRATLTEFLRNGLLATLGDAEAIAFFRDPANMTYCAEFMFVSLNTPVYPFNQQGLMKLLKDREKVEKILAIRDQHNKRKPTVLSQKTGNPEFKAYNIPMPVVPDDLLPLDELLEQQGQSVDAASLPFPPFMVSQLIRRAFRTLLKHQDGAEDQKLTEARAKLFKSMEPAIIQQLGLDNLPATDPKVQSVKQFLAIVSEELEKPAADYHEFDQRMDALLVQADEMLVGAGDRSRFVPPRIYVDLGQNDGDNNLPKGWGFHLETIGALVARRVIKG